MPIEIRINADTAELARHEMRQLLGVADLNVVWKKVEPEVQNDAGQTATAIGERIAAAEKTVSEGPTTYTQRIAGVRERGKPSPGHTRRTKAEIAEDEAAAKADAYGAGVASAMNYEAETQARDADDAQAANEAAQAAISTGEERVGPEDDAETIAQDEADEAAETAAAVAERPADKKLTLDDVRNALGAYVKVYGMDACQQDGPKVITLVCGAGKVKMSDIPDDQAVLAKVVAGIAEMTSKNPFQRSKGA